MKASPTLDVSHGHESVACLSPTSRAIGSRSFLSLAARRSIGQALNLVTPEGFRLRAFRPFSSRDEIVAAVGNEDCCPPPFRHASHRGHWYRVFALYGCITTAVAGFVGLGHAQVGSTVLFQVDLGSHEKCCQVPILEFHSSISNATDVFSLRFTCLAILTDFIAHLLPFAKRASALKGRYMDEDIGSSSLWRDEPKSLVVVEELHDAIGHIQSLFLLGVIHASGRIEFASLIRKFSKRICRLWRPACRRSVPLKAIRSGRKLHILESGSIYNFQNPATCAYLGTHRDLRLKRSAPMSDTGHFC